MVEDDMLSSPGQAQSAAHSLQTEPYELLGTSGQKCRCIYQVLSIIS